MTKPSEAELRTRLTPLAFQVTQHGGTEPPFQNAYWDHHAPGLYVDVVSGEPLFASSDKFDSGTGWPSFVQPVDAQALVRVVDTSHGMARVEVRSTLGDSHLGHVFEDGPAPTGLRYCINSAALRFIPQAELAAAGFAALAARCGGGEVAAQAGSCGPESCAATVETIYIAGGCFWGMEELLRRIPGVLDTEVGYAGGDPKATTYEQVKRGNTGHAETVRLVFDPKVISLTELLEHWFFRMHDPTTVDSQGNDRGSQYRSAIFTSSEAQAAVARQAIANVTAQQRWPAPIVTQVAPFTCFISAEGYHQDYLQAHPEGYSCHFLRTW